MTEVEDVEERARASRVVAVLGVDVMLLLVRAPVVRRGRRRLLDAVLAGGASVPVALAFRASLAVAAATFVVETLGGVHDDPLPPR